MKARAVIGANFGDEGKGLITDYLCAKEGAGVVVRHNGGAQAGHTVVTPDGRRHVFSHFGSGTFAGVPTYLSQFFLINPIAFFREWDVLRKVEPNIPKLYAHPDCLVTTYADMIINQRKEDARGDKRHGSCGLGINETVARSEVKHLKITMADLWNGVKLEGRLAEICGKYATFRTGKPIVEPGMMDVFQKQCAAIAGLIEPLGMGQVVDPIFEGAQGLLLDQNNVPMFPHVTTSNTGIKNVLFLCEQAGIREIEAYYVSRTYLTRHGAGPLPGESASLSYEDNTNLPHAYQGELRFAPLDEQALRKRIAADVDTVFAGKVSPRLVYTHCDQSDPALLSPADLYAYGPTRDGVGNYRRMIRSVA
jgi:adenylosuccinate synthase